MSPKIFTQEHAIPWVDFLLLGDPAKFLSVYNYVFGYEIVKSFSRKTSCKQNC